MENEALEPDVSAAEFEGLTPVTEIPSTDVPHVEYIISSSIILAPVSI
jgi:hypothetical protein